MILVDDWHDIAELASLCEPGGTRQTLRSRLERHGRIRKLGVGALDVWYGSGKWAVVVQRGDSEGSPTRVYPDLVTARHHLLRTRQSGGSSGSPWASHHTTGPPFAGGAPLSGAGLTG